VSFLPGFPGHFWTYFTIEKSYSKNVFSNMNLVNLQVYRVEKVGIFMHLYGKNRFLSFLSVISMYHGKLKFHITNQQIAIQTKFSGLKIEDILQQNMQQCAAKFAAPDFRI
jgi:hypothetical protein